MNFFEIIDIATQAIEHVGDNFCSEPGVLKGIRLVGYLLYIAKFAVPLIIIFFGTLDLFKSIQGGEFKAISKQAKVLGMRCILGLAIFLLPSVINWVLNSVTSDSTGNSSCYSCLLQPFSCSA